MSGTTQDVGSTLAGGVQDVSAILPLLGTDQCEDHVGSALDGGFLYAAAAPLSIFGSLGIVKVGFSVLISSMSIPKLSRSMKYSGKRWLGARVLDNAGFKPAGTVAGLIAMDGTRYKAETRLLQILEEKHVDNPENLSIEWKSRDWNLLLVLFTTIAAVFSVTPYIALLLQKTSLHTPWIYPLLRTVGSGLAAVFCQFLIQSRVISLMKSRIIFMTMNRILVDDLKSMHSNPEMDLAQEEHLRWDVDLPAEQCLWSLEQFIPSQRLSTQRSDDPDETAHHVSITMKTLSFSDPEGIRGTLQQLRNKHFPTPALDIALFLISWIILLLSLLATVVGYVGCFTLVTNSQNPGPFIWLGVEAALSIIRIVVWAWNPSWDEKTDITVKLELTKDQPLVTTEKNVQIIESTGDNTLALVPERRFLEWITPYTGPLEPFRSPENLTLYFVLTATGSERKRLYMTIFDFNKRIAVTLHREEDGFTYADADIVCNRIASKMEARLQSVAGAKHPWRTDDAVLFNELEKYYKSITHALNSTHPDLMAAFELEWNLELLPQPNNQISDGVLAAPSLHDQLYLDRGYEHHLKTNLVKNWTQWIVQDMGTIRRDAWNDCHHALKDSTSKEAKWELTELDSLLAWEWTGRELSVVLSSIKLERILGDRMQECMSKIRKDRGSVRLQEWMLSEFLIGQRKRLEKERGQMKERMEREMKDVSERAEREGRPWRDQGEFTPQWEAGLQFTDKLWSAVIEELAGIEVGHSALENAESKLSKLEKKRSRPPFGKQRTRFDFVGQVGQRFEHWRLQHENELHEMDATIEKIRHADANHLDNDYEYPEPDQWATLRFVQLVEAKSVAKVCSATVYDVGGCNNSLISEVIKSTTRSLINVHPDLLDSIPENDHLLYISYSSAKEPAFIQHNWDPWSDQPEPRKPGLFGPELRFEPELSEPNSSGKEPAFIQRNRDRWWDQQTSNSSMFYFSPEGVLEDCAYSSKATIAHIFIFLKTPSRIKLRLLHYPLSHKVSLSIQENRKQLCNITLEDIPRKLQLQDFDLGSFEPGKHELELVVNCDYGRYCLRDIFIEIVER